jgi:hypothetical protein
VTNAGATWTSRWRSPRLTLPLLLMSSPLGRGLWPPGKVGSLGARCCGALLLRH